MIHGDAGRASMGARQESWYQRGYSQIDMNDGLRMWDCLLLDKNNKQNTSRMEG